MSNKEYLERCEQDNEFNSIQTNDLTLPVEIVGIVILIIFLILGYLASNQPISPKQEMPQQTIITTQE